MPYRRLVFVQIALFVFLAARAVLAQNIVNGSFETGTAPGSSININAPDSTTIQGWTVTTGSIDYIGSRWVAGDGTRCVDLSGIGAGAILQTVTGFVPGQQYELSFLMAGNPEAAPAIKTLQASVGGTSKIYTFDNTGETTTHLGWTPQTLDFIATGSSVDVTFASQTSGFAGPALDLVNITPVPEPSVWALAGTSLALVLLVLRTRRHLTRGSTSP